MSATLNRNNNTARTRVIELAKKYAEDISDSDDSHLNASALCDPDNQPLTDELFQKAKRGRPFKAIGHKKMPVTIRLDPDVVAHFKAGGKGWQSKINDALRKSSGL